MNREALNMALQALETLMIERGSIYDKAITAIKESLADPSPNFNCKSVQARLATAWGYVKAQPEHEPVAWRWEKEDGYTSIETHSLDDEDMKNVGVKSIKPLYAKPQFIGLTDDEILSISADCASSHQHMDIQFARAIEYKLKEKNVICKN